MDEVRDERETGFYQIDNEMIDEYAARIGVHALAVYNALARYSNKGRCFPSLSTLQKVLGMSRPTVVKAIEKLKECKLIRAEKRSVGDAGHEVQQSTVYTLLRIKTGAHQVEGGSKGDLLPLVNAVDYGSKGDLPGVVNDVYSNKTKSNKTNLTSGGVATSDKDAAAAAVAVSIPDDGREVRERLIAIFTSTQQADTAIAAAATRGGFTLPEVELCEQWLDAQRPEWSGKVGGLYKTLKAGQLPVMPRANGNGQQSGYRRGPPMSEAPDETEAEIKLRCAALKAELLKDVPAWA